jgi:hypothetical protein
VQHSSAAYIIVQHTNDRWWECANRRVICLRDGHEFDAVEVVRRLAA